MGANNKQKLVPNEVSETKLHLSPSNEIIKVGNGKVIVSVVNQDGDEIDEFETSQQQYDKTYSKQSDRYVVKKN